MSRTSLRFDEVGAWSRLKLEIVEQYGAAYTRAFAHRGSRLAKFYVDGFSGAGIHIDKSSGEPVEGSPARAMKIDPPFDHFYFIDLNPDKTAYLQKLCDGKENVEIHTGDANNYLRALLPKFSTGSLTMPYVCSIRMAST